MKPIIAGSVQAVLEQMPPVWNGVYEYLKERHDVFLVIHDDLQGNLVFGRQFKVYAPNNDNAVFINVGESVDRLEIVTEYPTQISRDIVDLQKSDSFDRLDALIEQARELDDEDEL